MKITGMIIPSVISIPKNNMLIASWLMANIVLERLSLRAFPINMKALLHGDESM